MKSYLITQTKGTVNNEQTEIVKQLCLIASRVNGSNNDDETVHTKFNKFKELLIQLPSDEFKYRILETEIVVEQLINNEYIEFLSVWKIMAA